MIRRRNLGTLGLFLGAALLPLVAACKDGSGNGSATGGGATQAKWQGWDDNDRYHWYQATQGSRLVPWAWAQALERAEDQQPFFENGNLARYRFVPYDRSVSHLPIGFALDDNDDTHLTFTKLRWYGEQGSTEKWLGLNCSACHTAQVNFEGKVQNVDGAPSLVDFQGFIDGFDSALAATKSDSAKWSRFADKVLGQNRAANEAKLKTAFQQLLEWEQKNAHLNATDSQYGYGRLDAVGHIFNKVAQLATFQGLTDPPLKFSPRATPNPSDAPVSYPFLWDIYRQSQLQWNGIVVVKDPTTGKVSRVKLGNGFLDYSALGRNVGEVIGVFGDVDIKPAVSMTGYNSSIRADSLDQLEDVLRRLEAPKWPGTIDEAKRKAGEALYQSKGCKECHTIEAPGEDIYDIHMIRQTKGNRNNTDPWMACNAITYFSATGKLNGQPGGYISGDKLQETDRLATMLRTTVVGTLLGKGAQILKTAGQIFLGVEPLPRVVGARAQVSAAERRAGRLDQCLNAPAPFDKLFAYKARPLDGIWATAPYLHNGSVPTLYDLLLDPKDRPKSFRVGTRDYDPAKVGYSTDPKAPGNSFTYVATPDFMTAPTGNSNQGHDYNVGKLKPEERAALLEYLKSL